MSTALNIVFAGTPEFGIPCLQALLASTHHLSAVYTQPDRPSGRGQNMAMSPVKVWAMEHNLPVYQPDHFKSAAHLAALQQLQPDVLVVIAYGLILPQAVLDIPRLGCINVHASLLPRWRGASPIQHALLHGDDETGVTVMLMDSGMDTGSMLHWQRCPIDDGMTAAQLHDVLQHLSVEPLMQTLRQLSSGSCQPVPQDERLATYAPKIKKEHARIVWQHSAQAIAQQIRAYNPWPSAYTVWQDIPMKIHSAHVVAHTTQQPPGTVLAIDTQGILVATGSDCLCLQRIQWPGGKPLYVQQWYHARPEKFAIDTVLL